MGKTIRRENRGEGKRPKDQSRKDRNEVKSEIRKLLKNR